MSPYNSTASHVSLQNSTATLEQYIQGSRGEMYKESRLPTIVLRPLPFFRSFHHLYALSLSLFSASSSIQRVGVS
jgi:hypothetical protein